jgi:monoamine oxidase
MPPLHPPHFLIVGADHGGQNLADLSFLFSNATVPTWWTQHPAEYPVLTGWFAGPKADKVRLTETELIDMGLASLAEIFNVSPNCITRHLVASRAINWGNGPFARGAYSYATPKHEKRSQRWENQMVVPYSFLARRSMPVRIWARSRRR